MDITITPTFFTRLDPSTWEAVAWMCISESILAGWVRGKQNGDVSKCIAPPPPRIKQSALISTAEITCWLLPLNYYWSMAYWIVTIEAEYSYMIFSYSSFVPVSSLQKWDIIKDLSSKKKIVSLHMNFIPVMPLTYVPINFKWLTRHTCSWHSVDFVLLTGKINLNNYTTHRHDYLYCSPWVIY